MTQHEVRYGRNSLFARVLRYICHYMPRGGGILASRVWKLVTPAGCLPTLTWYGFPMFLDFNNGDHLSYWLGRYERGTEQVLRRELTPGALFIDAGANAGFYALMAGIAVGPKGRVVAFEPEPTIAGWLRNNVEMNNLKNIEVRQVALADKPGKAFFASRPNSGNSMLLGREGNTSVDGADTIEVDVSTLDEECRGLLKSWTDKVVLKMDIEGSELFALAGAKEVLERVDAAIVEMRPDFLKERGSTPKDLLTVFLQNRFSAYAIPDREGRLTQISQDYVGIGNLLFKRNRGTESKARE